MNWQIFRLFPWIDTRANFVAQAPRSGTLLDLGSSDGETLNHVAELRPDLKLFAVDVAGSPERYSPQCEFFRANLERDRLPWRDASIDAITCMHLIEHLPNLSVLLGEGRRLLRPGGKIYFETPHPRSLALSSPSGSLLGAFTLNFYDDPTHLCVVSLGRLAIQARLAGLEVLASGISRNWLFFASYPIFALLRPSRRKYTALAHWIGWSAYLIARRPREV